MAVWISTSGLPTCQTLLPDLISQEVRVPALVYRQVNFCAHKNLLVATTWDMFTKTKLRNQAAMIASCIAQPAEQCPVLPSMGQEGSTQIYYVRTRIESVAAITCLAI